MTRRSRPIPRLLAAAAIALCTAASAQTTAAGPYYATPSWDQTLPGSTRLVLLTNFNNQAVLDRETGLVWSQAPFTSWSAGTWQSDPFPSGDPCINASLGSRLGWRMPTEAELASLFDPTAPMPFLPVGHPFKLWSASGLYPGSPTSIFWSSTVETDADGSRHRLFAYINQYTGAVNVQRFYPGVWTNVSSYTFCVRAPTPSQQ
jgi:hypothetical protein